MHHLLAGSRIRLTYLQDRRALAGIDWPAIFDDLTDAGTPVTHWQWCDLDALTHVVLAIDRATGQYAGVLGLTARTAPVDWLMIDVALARPISNGSPLSRAMLAHVLARIVCLDGKPAGLAALAGNRDALADFGLNIRSVALHPATDGNVVDFRAAGLARVIGAGKTVLDLRAVSETSLLRDLRGIHSVRAGGVRSNVVRPDGMDGVRPDSVRPVGVGPVGVRPVGERTGGMRPRGMRPGRLRQDGVDPGDVGPGDVGTGDMGTGLAPAESVVTKPASSAAATRRPKKATHTGSNG